mmetsp:Transcript_125359/g.360133  ORF Transcript_125359/g.360133 Transcript_125359/m.360133 type:complete len:256 (-) Transcript_125359:93-860(-)
MASLRALAPTCLLLAASAAPVALDTKDYRDLELYIVADSPPRCYQIFPGSRLAKGAPNIGATPEECKRNWVEEADLGNFDGYQDDEKGSHFSGGSARGCSTWLKMFADDSLVAVQDTVKLEKEGEFCDLYITITGPTSAFGPKEGAPANPVIGGTLMPPAIAPLGGGTLVPPATDAVGGGTLATPKPSLRASDGVDEVADATREAPKEVAASSGATPATGGDAPFILMVVLGAILAAYCMFGTGRKRPVDEDSAE